MTATERFFYCWGLFSFASLGIFLILTYFAGDEEHGH